MIPQVVSRKRLAEFEKLVVSEPLLLSSLLPVVPKELEEDVGQVVMRVLRAHDAAQSLLENVYVPAELETTSKEALLFRGTGPHIFMLSEFMRLNGREYLRKTLRPALKIYIKKETAQYEVDPQRLEAGADLAKNTRNLTAATRFILAAILQSVTQVPEPLRQLLRRLFELVEARFPGAGQRALGSVFFLRFVSPVLASPESYGVLRRDEWTSLKPAAVRGLVLITKLVQAIANEVPPPPDKEPYMQPLVLTVVANIPALHTFYTALLRDGPKEVRQPPALSDASDKAALLLLARFMHTHADPMRLQLSARCPSAAAADALWGRLSALLGVLAPLPRGQSAASPTTPALAPLAVSPTADSVPTDSDSTAEDASQKVAKRAVKLLELWVQEPPSTSGSDSSNSESPTAVIAEP